MLVESINDLQRYIDNDVDFVRLGVNKYQYKNMLVYIEAFFDEIELKSLTTNNTRSVGSHVITKNSFAYFKNRLDILNRSMVLDTILNPELYVD